MMMAGSCPCRHGVVGCGLISLPSGGGGLFQAPQSEDCCSSEWRLDTEGLVRAGPQLHEIITNIHDTPTTNRTASGSGYYKCRNISGHMTEHAYSSDGMFSSYIRSMFEWTTGLCATDSNLYLVWLRRRVLHWTLDYSSIDVLVGGWLTSKQDEFEIETHFSFSTNSYR